MTPERAGTIFRELLQTPDDEIQRFSRRAGLQYSYSAEDLLMARELLEALGSALETGANRDWEAIRAAFGGLRTKRNPYLLGGGPAVLTAYAPTSAEPAPPPLVNRVVVAKPSLGDPPPGTREHAELAKGRFVPVARPRGGPADSPPLAAAPPHDPAGQAPPLPAQGYASPLAMPVAPPPPMVAPAAPVDEWHKPLPAMPALLAPIDASSAAVPTGGPFTRAVPAAAAPVAPASYVSAPPAAQRAAAPPPPPRRSPTAPAPSTPSPEPGPTEGAGAGGSVHESVARYAAFCAACAEFPDRLAQTRAGYGVPDDAARAALDSGWQDRFDDDPELLARWEELFVSFRRSFRAGG